MLVCLIIKGSCYSAHSLSFHTEDWTCSSERTRRGERSYRKRNQVESDQKDEIHLKVYSASQWDMQLWLREWWAFLFFLTSRLGSIQHCSYCSYCQLSKVGGITTSTGENNTLCFIGALWVCAVKKNQEMWATLHRELVKGGTSGKSRKRIQKKTKENKPTNIVTYCLQM